jgi:hypothetical protein
VNEETRVQAAMDRAGMDPGLYRKFRVERADGSSGPGSKHEHCTYFVLDWKHDKFAPAAARAYATACEVEYPALAQDLRNLAGEADAMWARLDPRHDVITGARE